MLSPSLADWARARFWELQIPLLVMPATEGGVETFSDYGERIHFPDQTSIQFFLLGYRLGESHATEPQPANPFATLVVPPEDENAIPPDQGE